MPALEYVELRIKNDLDRRRQRVAVHVRPEAEGAPLFLGDIWCSPATGRWHFTTNAGNLRRGDASAGYRTRADAAQALFDARIAETDARVHAAVAEANALREAAGEDRLIVTIRSR